MRWFPPWPARTRFPLVLTFCFLASLARAALPLNPPEAFFTNLAEKLLQQQMGLRMADIRVSPTNEYSAAVHRIFQVTANIYDAMNTNAYPAVFRPLFTTNAEGVFIAGFVCDNSAATLGAWLSSNPYGVPLVIAARKGIPHFNEYFLQTDVRLARRLQFTRANTNSLPNLTNQLYTLGISNQCGVEIWNPYTNEWTASNYLTVSNALQISITNSAGVLYSTNFTLSLWSITNVSFNIPFQRTTVLLSNFVYSFLNNTLSATSLGNFENLQGTPQAFAVPSLWMTLSNRLTYSLFNGGTILDHVSVADVETLDLANRVMEVSSHVYPIPELWFTNRSQPNGPTDGIHEQIAVSLGNVPVSDSFWHSGNDGIPVTTRTFAIANFRSFFRLPPTPEYSMLVNTSLVAQAPFNPVTGVRFLRFWQANDPLVRFHPDYRRYQELLNYPFPYLGPSNLFTSLGNTNDNYAPWGNALRKANDQYSFFPGLRDPGVFAPKNWNFPTNETPGSDWLGRVHRGTPWQTIYLKSDVASQALWLQQSGSPYHHPTNDWKLAALVAAELSAVGTNRISVNSIEIGAWSSTLAGLTVLSNSLSPVMVGINRVPEYDTFTIGVDNSNQVATIVNGINRTRSGQAGGYFAEVASLLGTPELSIASPWLNVSNQNTYRYGVGDEAYEALPSQLLGLVRADPVAQITRTASHVRIDFTACEPGTYAVQVSPDLLYWSDIPGNHNASNGTFSATLSAAAAKGFFRARLVE
jgi:hypothetical protein